MLITLPTIESSFVASREKYDYSTIVPYSITTETKQFPTASGQ